MKRAISFMLSLLLLLALLPACSQSAGEPDPPAPEAEEPAVAAQELAEAAFAFSGHGGELNTECLNTGENPDRLATYIEAVCALTEDQWEDAVLLFPRILNGPETIGYFDRLYNGGLQPVITDPDPDYPDRIRFTPPGEEDMSIYDTSAILAAWEKRRPVQPLRR